MNRNLWLGGLILISLIGCGASSEVKETTVVVAQPQAAQSGGQRIYIDPNTGLPTTPPNNQGITPPLPPEPPLVPTYHADGSMSLDLSGTDRFMNTMYATTDCAGGIQTSHNAKANPPCRENADQQGVKK